MKSHLLQYTTQSIILFSLLHYSFIIGMLQSIPEGDASVIQIKKEIYDLYTTCEQNKADMPLPDVHKALLSIAHTHHKLNKLNAEHEVPNNELLPLSNRLDHLFCTMQQEYAKKFDPYDKNYSVEEHLRIAQGVRYVAHGYNASLARKALKQPINKESIERTLLYLEKCNDSSELYTELFKKAVTYNDQQCIVNVAIRGNKYAELVRYIQPLSLDKKTSFYHMLGKKRWVSKLQQQAATNPDAQNLLAHVYVKNNHASIIPLFQNKKLFDYYAYGACIANVLRTHPLHNSMQSLFDVWDLPYIDIIKFAAISLERYKIYDILKDKARPLPLIYPATFGIVYAKACTNFINQQLLYTDGSLGSDIKHMVEKTNYFFSRINPETEATFTPKALWQTTVLTRDYFLRYLATLSFKNNNFYDYVVHSTKRIGWGVPCGDLVDVFKHLPLIIKKGYDEKAINNLKKFIAMTEEHCQQEPAILYKLAQIYATPTISCLVVDKSNKKIKKEKSIKKCVLTQQDMPKALILFKKSAALEYKKAYYRLGNFALLIDNDIQQALKYYEHAPSSIKILIRRAELLTMLNRYDEAAKICDNIENDQNPDNKHRMENILAKMYTLRAIHCSGQKYSDVYQSAHAMSDNLLQALIHSTFDDTFAIECLDTSCIMPIMAQAADTYFKNNNTDPRNLQLMSIYAFYLYGNLRVQSRDERTYIDDTKLTELLKYALYAKKHGDQIGNFVVAAIQLYNNNAKKQPISLPVFECLYQAVNQKEPVHDFSEKYLIALTKMGNDLAKMVLWTTHNINEIRKMQDKKTINRGKITLMLTSERVALFLQKIYTPTIIEQLDTLMEENNIYAFSIGLDLHYAVGAGLIDYAANHPKDPVKNEYFMQGIKNLEKAVSIGKDLESKNPKMFTIDPSIAYIESTIATLTGKKPKNTQRAGFAHHT